MGNPLPESCVGLFVTLCTEWIIKKTNTKHMTFAQQSQTSEHVKARLRFGSTKKRKVATKTNSYKRYRDILFQKVASGYLLHFVPKGSSKKQFKAYSPRKIHKIK